MRIDEKSLQESEKYKLLTQLMPIAVYTTDSMGIITFYNKKAAELWGRSPRLNDPTEVRFCGSWKIFTPEGKVLPHDKCPMALALKSGKPYKEREICVEQPDGTRRFALANIDLLRGMDGKITGAINVLYDITDKKLADEYESRLAAIVRNSDDAIVSKTLKGIITSWNKGAERIFGYTEEEVVGKSITILIPKDRLQEEELILGRISKGKMLSHYETIRLKKDGTEIHVSLTVSPVKNSNGKIIGASKIARNITDQVLVKQQMEEYTRKLEELSKQKDEFIGLASHELKTPLTVTKGFLQLLEMEQEGENPYIQKALEHVEKLNNLVAELLNVSRIESGKMQLNLSKVGLDQLVRETIDNFRFNSSREITFEGAKDVKVLADRPRLEQVLVNLIGNAIKYSPKTEKVEVRVMEKDGMAIVEVEDWGIGVQEDQRDRLFTRFFRARGVDPSISGLGVGLYISKEIVKYHKGRIGMEDKNGKGSIFHFSIPVLNGEIKS